MEFLSFELHAFFEKPFEKVLITNTSLLIVVTEQEQIAPNQAENSIPEITGSLSHSG